MSKLPLVDPEKLEATKAFGWSAVGLITLIMLRCLLGGCVLKEADKQWAQTRLADVASEIFRTLVVKREVPPTDAADLLSMAMSRAMFEATLMRGKIAGKIRSSMTSREAIADLKVHEIVSEAILATEIGSLQMAHSKYIWTGWISKRIKPL